MLLAYLATCAIVSALWSRDSQLAQVFVNLETFTSVLSTTASSPMMNLVIDVHGIRALEVLTVCRVDGCLLSRWRVISHVPNFNSNHFTIASLLVLEFGLEFVVTPLV